MSIIANSTISETPIGVESIASPVSDLRLESFVSVSRTFAIEDTATLILSNGVDEVITSYNIEGDDGALELSSTDNVIRSLSYSIASELKLDSIETSLSSVNSVDNASLTLVAFEKPDDDVASEEWRPYPGLPIQPIGYSPIASEQFDINFRSFSEINDAPLEISASDTVQIVLNSIDAALANIGDADTVSSTIVTESQGNIGILSFDSRETYLNSYDTAYLGIQAEDQVSVTLAYSNSLETNIASSDQTSISYFSYDSADATITSRTFTKEYTFLQQEFIIDTIQLSIDIDSNETYVASRGAIINRSTQIWIG